MASTNHTPNLGLPQFVDTDKPGWLTDINTAMIKIDEGVHKAETDASQAITTANDALGETADYAAQIEEAKNLANEANTTAVEANATAGSAVTTANTANSAASAAQNTANNAQTSATTANNTISDLKSKLLISSDDTTTETFTINSANNKQLVGSLGHIITVTGTESEHFETVRNFTIRMTNSGEFKMMGEINIRRTIGAGNIKLTCEDLFPSTLTMNLSLHALLLDIIGSENGEQYNLIHYLEMGIENGAFTAQFRANYGCMVRRILFLDSIITQPIITTPPNPVE